MCRSMSKRTICVLFTDERNGKKEEEQTVGRHRTECTAEDTLSCAVWQAQCQLPRSLDGAELNPGMHSSPGWPLCGVFVTISSKAGTLSSTWFLTGGLLPYPGLSGVLLTQQYAGVSGDLCAEFGRAADAVWLVGGWSGRWVKAEWTAAQVEKAQVEKAYTEDWWL